MQIPEHTIKISRNAGQGPDVFKLPVSSHAVIPQMAF